MLFALAAVRDVLSETVSLETLFNELTEGGRDDRESADAVAASEVAQ